MSGDPPATSTSPTLVAARQNGPSAAAREDFNLESGSWAGAAASSALKRTVFLHNPPGTFFARQSPQLERLKETCVCFARHQHGLQAADAEDLYQTSCVEVILTHKARTADRDLPTQVMKAFLRELERFLDDHRRSEHATVGLSERFPASVLDDPVMGARLAELPRMEALVSALLTDTWRERIESYLHGEPISSIARRMGRSPECIRQGFLRLRKECIRNRDRLLEYLP